MAFFFASQSATVCWILVNFSTGNLACILHVSKIMPRNDNVMLGPSTISSTRGTPRISHILCIVSMYFWHILVSGGPIAKKSST